MSPNCSQSLHDGKPCNAPAMNGSRYCRHHDPQRPSRSAQTQIEKAPETQTLELPNIYDKQAALVAIDQVIQALASGRIRRSVAHTLLSAINSATRLMDEILEEGEAGITYESGPRPQTIALAASGNPCAAKDPATTKLPQSAFQNDIDPSTARLVKQLLAQTHQFAKGPGRREPRLNSASCIK